MYNMISVISYFETETSENTKLKQHYKLHYKLHSQHGVLQWSVIYKEKKKSRVKARYNVCDSEAHWLKSEASRQVGYSG